MNLFHWLLTNWIETAGVITTVLGIWLTTRRTLACWPVVLVADVLYLIVFSKAHLYSDALLQIFFVAFNLYGWWHWSRGVRNEGAVRVIPLAALNLFFGLIAGAVGGLLLGQWMKHLNAALPYLDAELASYSLVASWWQARKHTANWGLWIVVNIFYVGEYIYKGLRPTAVLYAGLVGLAAWGWSTWYKAAAVQTSERKLSVKWPSVPY